MHTRVHPQKCDSYCVKGWIWKSRISVCSCCVDFKKWSARPSIVCFLDFYSKPHYCCQGNCHGSQWVLCTCRVCVCVCFWRQSYSVMCSSDVSLCFWRQSPPLACTQTRTLLHLWMDTVFIPIVCVVHHAPRQHRRITCTTALFNSENWLVKRSWLIFYNSTALKFSTLSISTVRNSSLHRVSLVISE